MVGSWSLYRGACTHIHTPVPLFPLGRSNAPHFQLPRNVIFFMTWLDVKGNIVVKMSKSKLHQLGKGQNRHVENKELT